MGPAASENPSQQIAPENPSHKHSPSLSQHGSKYAPFGKITHWPVCNARQFFFVILTRGYAFIDFGEKGREGRDGETLI